MERCKDAKSKEYTLAVSSSNIVAKSYSEGIKKNICKFPFIEIETKWSMIIDLFLVATILSHRRIFFHSSFFNKLDCALILIYTQEV